MSSFSSFASSGGGGGGLTDAQLRASAVPVSATFYQATQPVSIAGNQGVDVAKINAVTPLMGNGVTGTGSLRVTIASDNTAFNVNAVQSGTWNIGSITTMGALVAGTALIGKVGLDQTTPGTTNAVSLSHIGSTAIASGNGVVGGGVQRVAIASDNTAFSVNTTLQTGANVIGALTANQSVNVAQMNGVAVTMGSGVVGTGVQRVVLATDVALPAGANIIGALTANQSVNCAQIAGVATATGNGVVGTGVQRVAIASDNSAFSVNATGPTLTKATQGATGFSTQDLKDAGRVSFGAATVIGGVAAVSTEALLSMVPVRAGVASAGATTIAVTAGKRLRVQAIIASIRSTGATVLAGRVALRMNPSGAVAANSPIIAILSMTQQAAALAEAGDTCVLPLPDGLEFSGTEQIGLTQVCSGTGGVVYASIVGFEY